MTVLNNVEEATLNKLIGFGLLLIASLGSQAIAQQTVRYDFDSKKLKSIIVNGDNLMTGNGIYLIGSLTGADGVLGPFNSPNSLDGLRLMNGYQQYGAPFKLQFSQNGSGTLSFIAEIGPVEQTYETLSMPFDFGPTVMDRFAFDGSNYLMECTGTVKKVSNDAYSSITPQCHVVKDEKTGEIVARVGVAIVRSPVLWAEVSGPKAKVRVTIKRSSHYTSLRFHRHTGTHNLELSFGKMQKGEKAFVEGEVIVTPKSSGTTWIFENERHFSHQIGRPDADGWSVRVGDRPGQYMSYGPYTTAIPNGLRNASFRLLVDNNAADNLRLLTLDVYDATAKRRLAFLDIPRKQFKEPFKYQEFSLPFNAVSGHQLEFRTFWHNYSYIRQDKVTVR